jgi:uncharacterized membrane protein YhaH (DUF805 family)
MDISEAVKTVLQRKYADFNGRAARPEFWWFLLFNVIVLAILSVVDAVVFGSGKQFLAILYDLAVLIPSLAVSVRRLHDKDKSGWWVLIALVPIIGGLLLLYWYATPGTEGDNQFGPPPAA